jgi:hypothetical protein
LLHLAVHFGLIPTVSRSQLGESSDIEVTAVRDLRVPVYADEAYRHPLVQEVREQVRELTLKADGGHGEELLRAVSRALDGLREAAPGNHECNVQIGIARFPYRPWNEGPTALRQHPVILKVERREADGGVSTA